MSLSPQKFSGRESTVEGFRSDEQKVQKKADGQAIHKAMENFIKAINDNPCEEGSIPYLRIFTWDWLGLEPRYLKERKSR